VINYTTPSLPFPLFGTWVNRSPSEPESEWTCWDRERIQVWILSGAHAQDQTIENIGENKTVNRRTRQESELGNFLQLYFKDHTRKSASRRVSAIRPRARRNRRLFFTVIIFGALLGTVTTFSWSYLSPGPASRPINRLRAAVVDELSLTDPDPAFLANATGSLSAAGYHVDYYPPSQATVSFFQTLPTLGYGLLIIRAHASRDAIITSQPFSQSQYVWPQLTGSILDEKISNGNDYFAVTADFVSNQMQGNFQGATIIVMGCQTTEGNPDLAVAFIHRGAGAYIGWNNVVSLQYTDASTASLLRLISQGKPVEETVQAVGAQDPIYHSRLVLVDSSSLAANQLASTLNLLRQLGVAALMFIPGPLVLGLILRRLWRL
jgi:hypothetical protein